MPRPIESFAPQFVPNEYTNEDKRRIGQFFTNLDRSVYALLIPSPELVGALCSRMSRATQDIRAIFLREFIDPFLRPDRLPEEPDDAFAERRTYGNELHYFIEFLEAHPFETLFANPRARRFYVQWLAEYGDDSIAQMAGMHLAFSGISQVAIKHIENMRIGIAPIEKSTRYVDYSKKVGGRFLYYTDPSLEDLGLRDEYEAAMDGLFNTYTVLIPRLAATLQKKFPDIPQKVIEKKAFDTLRGLLPMATLSQVSFFGNGQAFEYMMARSLRHPLGEIRWTAEEAYRELSRIGPSFFRRLKGSKEGSAEAYQEYLANRKNRMAPFVKEFLMTNDRPDGITKSPEVTVRLIEKDPEDEAKVITGMLYGAPNSHRTWKEIYEEVLRMHQSARERILRANLEGRNERWQRVSRAFEHVYTLFEIEMNIGAWRDLHRHRMLTQEHQFFTCHHGYDTPPEIIESGLLPEFSGALENAKAVFLKIAERDPHLAQYAVPLAYRVRFIQRENLRQSFWQIELRTISQGHTDYRHVEQEKYRLLKSAYPLLAPLILADMAEYDFARRETEARIERKRKELESAN